MGLCFGRNSDKVSKRESKNHPKRSPEELHLLSAKSRKQVANDISPRDTIMGETQSTQKKDPQGPPPNQSKNQPNGKQASTGKGLPSSKPISNSAGDNHVVRLNDYSDSDDSSDDDAAKSFNPPLKQASMSIPHFDSVDLDPKPASAREPRCREPWGVGRGVGSSQDTHFSSTRSVESSYYGDTTSSESSDSQNTSAPSIIRTKLSAGSKKPSSGNFRPRAPSQPAPFQAAVGKPFPLASQESHENLSYSSIREEIRAHPEMLNEPSHSPKLIRSAVPPHVKNDFHRIKSSSTSTLFMNSTIKAPDNEEIVRCMAKALYWAVKKSETVPRKRIMDVFNEELHPLEDYAETDTPSEDVIFKFLSVIFSGEQLSAECGVMGMAYIDRLMALTGVTMCGKTWRRIVLGALILASKVWEDQAVWNVDFLSVFPKVTVKDLNSLERAMLNALQFNVSLKASVYAKYYFELRSLSERDAQHFPLLPLDHDGSAKLEARSRGLEKESRKKRITRSRSADEIHSSSRPFTLPQ